jgi:uncharacterized protein (TIGR02646 family)
MGGFSRCYGSRRSSALEHRSTDMIVIVRPKAPPDFDERTQIALARLRETADAGGYRTQRRFRFQSRYWSLARDELAVAGQGKCAYCETHIGPTGGATVDHFRPKTRATGMPKGDTAPDHYWWLAYSWDNLVYSCMSCNRAKRSKFPVRGRRAEPFESTASEDPLLLNPYGREDPARHLSFDTDGLVEARTEIGHWTISVLQLNRPDLVEARSARAVEVLSSLDRLDADSVSKMGAAHQPYAAMVRDLLDRHFSARDTSDNIHIVDGGEAAVDSRYEPPATSEISPAVLGTTWIEEIDVVNFGCVEELQLRFSEPTSSREPWIVLLGANGVGKSTVLKAVALALSSTRDRRRLVKDASRYLNLNTRARSGHVRIKFKTGEEVRMEVRKGESEFFVVGARPAFNLVGYGSTRLLHRDKRKKLGRASGPRLDNLFDPWAPLVDAEPWLADPGRVAADDFKVLAASLKTLLSVGVEVELRRRSGDLRARLFEKYLNLEDLSDGYQSVLAFALDLSMGMSAEMGQGFSTENFEGLVLIDELEVHLHPEWKLRVVADLRSIFPNLQFLATTHDPLCLRGLEAGEVNLLRRDELGITVEQIDVPSGLDADEILTGEWFGLETTLDSEVHNNLLEYRALRLEGHSPDSPEMAGLRSKLELSLGSYAGTSLGGVMVEAAGEFLAEQTTSAEPSRKLSKNDIKERLLSHARETVR